MGGAGVSNFIIDEVSMKRKYADRPNWKRVLSRRMIGEELEIKSFKGYAMLICIDEVREDLWVEICGNQTKVAGDGYYWLTMFPAGERYVVTAMFDEQQNIVQWYIDICSEIGFGKEGVPWYDDLYLDIIIDAHKNHCLIDQEDLERALRQKIIKKQDYDFAYREANRVIKLIENDKLEILELSRQIRTNLLTKLQIQK